MPAPPRVLRQQCRTGAEIAVRRGVRCRGFGAFAREQVELGQLLAFVLFGDQRGATIELIDDLEDRLLALPTECARRAASRFAGGTQHVMLPGSANRRLPAPCRG